MDRASVKPRVTQPAPAQTDHEYVRRAQAMLDAYPLFHVPINEWVEVCRGLAEQAVEVQHWRSAAEDHGHTDAHSWSLSTDEQAAQLQDAEAQLAAERLRTITLQDSVGGCAQRVATLTARIAQLEKELVEAPMTSPDTTARQAVDRELLRTAGEHLGTLAERAKEPYDLCAGYRSTGRHKVLYARYAKLARLSREVLEIAHE